MMSLGARLRVYLGRTSLTYAENLHTTRALIHIGDFHPSQCWYSYCSNSLLWEQPWARGDREANSLSHKIQVQVTPTGAG